MIRLLLEARDADTGEPLDDVALRNEAAVIFMAGPRANSEFARLGLVSAVAAPQTEERLHAELAKTLAGRLPTLDDVPELPYTRRNIRGNRAAATSRPASRASGVA